MCVPLLCEQCYSLSVQIKMLVAMTRISSRSSTVWKRMPRRQPGIRTAVPQTNYDVGLQGGAGILKAVIRTVGVGGAGGTVNSHKWATYLVAPRLRMECHARGQSHGFAGWVVVRHSANLARHSSATWSNPPSGAASCRRSYSLTSSFR